VAGHEPLRLECEHFLECIRTGAKPRTDGMQGLKVVQALEMAGVSLAQGGVMIPLPGLVEAGAPARGRTAEQLSMVAAY